MMQAMEALSCADSEPVAASSAEGLDHRQEGQARTLQLLEHGWCCRDPVLGAVAAGGLSAFDDVQTIWT